MVSSPTVDRFPSLALTPVTSYFEDSDDEDDLPQLQSWERPSVGGAEPLDKANGKAIQAPVAAHAMPNQATISPVSVQPMASEAPTQEMCIIDDDEIVWL